jgi:hypothetical protein
VQPCCSAFSYSCTQWTLEYSVLNGGLLRAQGHQGCIRAHCRHWDQFPLLQCQQEFLDPADPPGLAHGLGFRTGQRRHKTKIQPVFITGYGC